MNPLEINVHINIGVTSELTQLLSAFIGFTPIVKKEEKKPKKVEKVEATIEAPAQTQKKEEPVAVEEDTTAAEEDKPKEYTEEDVRAAMARARERIEGEDYKLKTDSEGYKKWHRRLTAWFKNTAATYGAEKPSLLEDSEKRRCFIDDCDRVVAEGDELRIPIPF